MVTETCQRGLWPDILTTVTFARLLILFKELLKRGKKVNNSALIFVIFFLLKTVHVSLSVSEQSN